MLGIAAAGSLSAATVIASIAWRSATARRAERRSDALHADRGADGVVRGAETIELPLPHGDAAVLVLHGAGDTPQSVSYLAAYLHARGYAVRAPLLPRHGRTIQDFAHASADEWTAAAAAELQSLRAQIRWVGVIGVSMGGALAVQLAAAHRDLPALGLVAPYLAMPRRIALAAKLAPLWSWLVPYISSRDDRSVLDPQERRKSLGYDAFSAGALQALRETVQRAATALPGVEAPALIIQSRQDNRITPASAEHAFARLGSQEKRLVWVEGAGHVLTVDFGREHVFEALASWMDRYRGRQRPHGGGAFNQ